MPLLLAEDSGKGGAAGTSGNGSGSGSSAGSGGAMPGVRAHSVAEAPSRARGSSGSSSSSGRDSSGGGSSGSSSSGCCTSSSSLHRHEASTAAAAAAAASTVAGLGQAWLLVGELVWAAGGAQRLAGLRRERSRAAAVRHARAAE